MPQKTARRPTRSSPATRLGRPGGCGLLITEFCAVDGENGIAETHQLQIHAPRFIKRLALLTDTLHRYDCKVFFQLFHPGREGKPQFNGGRQVISASGIVNPATGRVSHEMTREEIHGMVDKFVTGAVYAQQANADGVELHCAHGYLLHQFLSPHSNVRADEYGGSLENRMRIVREIIEGIHRACGRDFPISVRINGCDYIPEGLQKADAVEIAKLLERYGASCINVSSGGYENPAAFIEPCYFPEGWKKENALAVKAAVQIPVIAVNVIKHPATAEALLREGVCDFAGVSRAQLADPDWVSKARGGQEALLRKCIGCMSCNKEVVNHRGIRCAHQPTARPRAGLQRRGAAARRRGPVRTGDRRRACRYAGGHRPGRARLPPDPGLSGAPISAAVPCSPRKRRAKGLWPSTSRRRKTSSPRSACRWS